jgi:mono/diheme cytochrome c family protein
MRTLFYLPAMAILALASCNSSNEQPAGTKNDDIEQTRKLEGEALVKRGNYIVTAAACNDCHSPKIMTPQGPIVDSSKMLSGYPATSQLPLVDASAYKPGNWMGMAPDATAFVGPWGISYAANLTSDSTTGIGAWTKEVFIQTLRTGKHLGLPNGRPIMPPMPWNYINQYTDEDLGAIYAYLQSLPAVTNRVPEYTPPSTPIASK